MIKYEATCAVCNKVVFTGNIRNISTALGKHRDKEHADIRGTIRYKTKRIVTSRRSE